MAARISLEAQTDLPSLTQYCKATADQLRLQIVRVLSRESFGVLELCQILEVGQPALSHHLKILANAGLVETRREGTSSYYRRALVSSSDPIRDLRHAFFEAVDLLPMEEVLQERIEGVHASRHQRAKSFFEKNAQRFQENQNLIVEYPEYAGCIGSILDNELFKPGARVVEVGPGESELLGDLARRFAAVVAIDNNDEMLGKAKQLADSQSLTNITFVPGELRDYEGDADLIVLNMVLHHLASPSGFFIEARRHLAEDGRLLVADLLAHDQDWTREACGDLWLGFDPEELDSLAIKAGFSPAQSQYLGLNNGFLVQVRTYA